MSGYLWTPIGVFNSGEGTKPFSGIFDGQGHSISGLFVNALSAETENTGYGLFAVNAGMVKSLTVKNSLVAAAYYASAAAGVNEGTLDDVFVKNAKICSGVMSVGGETAWNYGGTIRNCGVDAEILSSYSDDACGGMLAGTNSNGATIKNCWSLGSITGDCVGGITWKNSATIANCWSAATGENNDFSISENNSGTFQTAMGLTTIISQVAVP